MLLLCIIALVILVIWTVLQFVPAPAWASKVALIILLWCLTLLACGIGFVLGT